MADIDKLKGLKALIQDAVEQGASAVERVHLGTAKRPFTVLKSIAPIEKPVENIEAVHDAIVSGTYASVRAVTRVAGKVLDTALDALDEGKKKDTTPEGQ
jgi:hypothetical protein